MPHDYQTTKLYRVERAISLLREARDHLMAAEAPASLDKVRRAIKSTEGALRHAQRIDHEIRTADMTKHRFLQTAGDRKRCHICRELREHPSHAEG